LLASLCAGPAIAAAGPVKIGNRRELFVDHHLIEKLEGSAELRLHKPRPREVVIVHDKPWEGNTCGYNTIFKDGDLYRMYYRGWNHKGRKATHPPFVCYAQSKDGIHWTKPQLGLVKFDGSAKNNIIWTGRGAHNFTPFLDTNRARKPGEKYKAVGGLRGEGGLFAFCSADGVRWQALGAKPIITAGAFDSQNLAFWDSVRGQYRAYFRDFHNGVRSIKTATSRDFLTWSKPVWLEYPGAPREHLYTNQVRPYYRAPHLFVGFPTRYIPARGSLVEGLFMTSRDGRTFRRWGQAVIRPGPNKDRWHNRSNYIWWGLVETKSDLPSAGNELSLYTNERYYKGLGVKTRRYTYRIDGFVSAHARLSGGKVLTRPLTFSGSRLLLNVSTSAAGSVRVELRDADGRPVEGFRASDCPEIYCDEIERVVKWKGGPDVSSLQGKAVRLVFLLKDADLYAFRFVDGKKAAGDEAQSSKPSTTPARRVKHEVSPR